MSRPHALPLLLLVLAVLAGCTDQALVDRVAELEAADERLRDSLQDVGAPDPQAQADAEAAQAELEATAARISEVETSIEALQADLDAQVLELDGRTTTTELQLDEARASLTELRADLSTLTDRVNSLEAQFDAHRSDPSGHGG